MTRYTVAAISAALLATASYAAYAQTHTAQEVRTVDRDFTKLSLQGRIAMQEVQMARADIFNGRIAQASSAVDAASAALDKAKMDRTAFVKAESALVAPANVNQPKSDTTAKQWLPIDSSMALGEDYQASTQHSAALAKANSQIAKGDQKHAIETLKLTGVDVSYTQELAPLDATMSGVHAAQRDIAAAHYYQANQDLKAVQDGIRFDTFSTIDVPKPVHS